MSYKFILERSGRFLSLTEKETNADNTCQFDNKCHRQFLSFEYDIECQRQLLSL